MQRSSSSAVRRPFTRLIDKKTTGAWFTLLSIRRMICGRFVVAPCRQDRLLRYEFKAAAAAQSGKRDARSRSGATEGFGGRQSCADNCLRTKQWCEGAVAVAPPDLCPARLAWRVPSRDAQRRRTAAFARKLRGYPPALLAHHLYPLHGSVTEDINSMIKVIKWAAYGFHADQYFFLKIRDAFHGIWGIRSFFHLDCSGHSASGCLNKMRGWDEGELFVSRFRARLQPVGAHRRRICDTAALPGTPLWESGTTHSNARQRSGYAREY